MSNYVDQDDLEYNEPLLIIDKKKLLETPPCNIDNKRDSKNRSEFNFDVTISLPKDFFNS